MVGEQVDVFGDALVGVVRFAGQAQAVVFVAFEPVLLELLGQVGAPAEDERFCSQSPQTMQPIIIAM